MSPQWAEMPPKGAACDWPSASAGGPFASVCIFGRGHVNFPVLTLQRFLGVSAPACS